MIITSCSSITAKIIKARVVVVIVQGSLFKN
jgi:hypothetical protein